MTLLWLAALPLPASAQHRAPSVARGDATRAPRTTRTSQVPDGSPALGEIPRWDLTGVLGWRGVRLRDDDLPYREWDHRAVFVGIAGYYWTSHLKIEMEAGGVSPSRFQVYRTHQLPGVSSPAYLRTEHDAVGVPFSGRLLYQFGENAWFHPFAGAGVALDWTRDRVHTPFQQQPVRRPDGQYDQVVVATGETHTETTRDTRPMVILGFKAYGSERAFVRADLLWTVGATHRGYQSWRVGVGMDF